MTVLLAMAGLGMAFDASQHAERRNTEAKPAGWYKVQIVNSEIKAGSKQGSARLNLQFKILDGDFAGQILFGGYNVRNDNPVAVTIAMEELAELSRAVGVPVWQDTNQLHMIPFNLKVKVKVQDGYDPSNEPQRYQHINDNVGMVYATKADLANMPKAQPKATPASGGFGTGAPQQAGNGFGQPAQQQQQPQQQNGFNQTQQQPANTGFNNQATQQQPQTQQQQPANTGFGATQQQVQTDPGTTNFGAAAATQPWADKANQEPQQQQVQQQVQQQQPAQEQQVQQQVNTQQPSWANQQVQAGTEQPVQQQQQQAQQQPADAIAQEAQVATQPWRVNLQD